MTPSGGVVPLRSPLAADGNTYDVIEGSDIFAGFEPGIIGVVWWLSP